MRVEHHRGIVLVLLLIWAGVLAGQQYGRGNSAPFEPYAGSTTMFHREISEPAMMRAHFGAWQVHPLAINPNQSCSTITGNQTRISPNMTYPASLTQGDVELWQAGDLLADWMANTFAFVVVVQGAAIAGSLEGILFSLIATPELRLCKVFVACSGSTHMVARLQRGVHTILQQSPFSARGLLFANVHVVSSGGAPMDWHGNGSKVMQLVRQFTTAEFVIVLPQPVPLPYTFRAYTFAVAHEGDKRGMLNWMGKVIRPLEGLNASGAAYMLGNTFPAGHVLPLGGWGPEPTERITVPPVRVVPRHSRWFLKDHFVVPYLKEGCKILMYASNVCTKRTPTRKEGKGYVWGCDDLNPLIHFNPTRYFNKKDSVAEYVAEHLTIVITGHLVPSAPSTFLVRSLVQSLHMMPELRLARIILSYDGTPANTSRGWKAYKHHANIQALINKNPLFKNAEFLALGQQGLLHAQLEAAVMRVKTPFMLILQPDLPFVRPAEMYYLLRSMEANKFIKHTRFNRNNNVAERREKLFGVDTRVHDDRSYVPLVRTHAWSSMNYMVSVEECKRILKVAKPGIETQQMQSSDGKYFKIYRKNRNLPATMENVMFQYLTKEYTRTQAQQGDLMEAHKNWGTYMYGYMTDAPYILHVDGTEKYGPSPPEYFEPF